MAKQNLTPWAEVVRQFNANSGRRPIGVKRAQQIEAEARKKLVRKLATLRLDLLASSSRSTPKAKAHRLRSVSGGS
jgi:hypothetical protein